MRSAFSIELKVEFLVSSLYYNEEYSHVLQLLLDALDESKKSMGGLSRELIDTGIRSALKAGDTQNAVMLARMTRDQACSTRAKLLTAVEKPVCRDCDRVCGCLHCCWLLARWDRAQILTLTVESLQPLLVSTAAFGLHEPVLSRLSLVITTLNKDGSLDSLLAAVDAVKAKQKYSLQRPFFAWDTTSAVTPAHLAPTTVNLDHRVIASALGIDNAHLQKTLSRLEKAMGGSEEESQTERGVREL